MTGAHRVAWALGLAAIVAQISNPLTTGSARDAVTVGVVLLLAAAAVTHAASQRGARFVLVLLVVTTVGGFVVELVGTRTGLPFGTYTYAPGRLGPELAGVPLVIGVAWTAGAYPAWCAAQRVAGDRRVLGWLLAAAGLAGWDLYLDPQMVADGRWRWTGDVTGLPGLPDIPVSNYLGWVGVALVMTGLLTTVRRRRTGDDRLPLLLFSWTWLGSALAHAVFLGLPASAGYGLLAMGVLGVPLAVSVLGRRALAPGVASLPGGSGRGESGRGASPQGPGATLAR